MPQQERNMHPDVDALFKAVGGLSDEITALRGEMAALPERMRDSMRQAVISAGPDLAMMARKRAYEYLGEKIVMLAAAIVLAVGVTVATMTGHIKWS
jgi:hypothetical protein